MAGTIVNNMTNLNAADAVTGWTGVSASLYTTFEREATGCLGEKVSATNMEAYVTPLGSPRNMANETIHGWCWIQGAPDTYANFGFSIIVGDGTNRAGFPCAGSDLAGFAKDAIGWHCIILSVPDKLDVEAANLAGTTASIDDGNITQVGFYITPTTSALGNVDNVFWDILWAYDHTGYAVEITAGTSGSPATFSDLAAYDASLADLRALGVLFELATGVFGQQAPVQIGDDGTGSSYFSSTNEEVIFSDVGHINNHKFAVVGNATGTNEAYFTSVTFRNVHSTLTPSLFFNGGDIDNLEFVGCVFLGVSPTFSSSADASGHVVDTCTFDGCVTITPGSVDFDDCLFANTENPIVTSSDIDFLGCSFLTPAVLADEAALEWNGAFDPNGNLDGSSFTKGALAHHAIEFGISSPLTMTLTDIDFSGFNASDGQNDSTLYIKRTSGTVTINLSGVTGNVSYKTDGATVVIANSVTIEITGVTEGARAAIHKTSDDTELLNDLAFTSDGAGGFKASASFDYGAGPDVPVRVGAASSGKVVAGLALDSAVNTDETRQANDSRTGAGNTMTLLPTASPAAGDGFLFGHTEQFFQMDLDILTAGAGTYTLDWEYWDGTGWSALTVTDDTNDYKTSGVNLVSWTDPGDWATKTETNQPGTTALYYIRAVKTGAGTVTTTPVGRTAHLDVTKYLRWEAENTITSSGLSVKATWLVDETAIF